MNILFLLLFLLALNPCFFFVTFFFGTKKRSECGFSALVGFFGGRNAAKRGGGAGQSWEPRVGRLVASLVYAANGVLLLLAYRLFVLAVKGRKGSERQLEGCIIRFTGRGARCRDLLFPG